MARESKRKRDERRFGKPQRLIDLILTTPLDRWALPLMDDLVSGGPALTRQMSETAGFFREVAEKAVPIVADNVGEFYYTTPKNVFDYQTDFPTPMPPFPTTFIETGRPTRIVCGDNVYEWPEFYPHRYGCLVKTGTVDSMPLDVIPGAHLLLEKAAEKGIPFYLVLQMGFAEFGDGRPWYDHIGQFLCLDRQGAVLCQPFPVAPFRVLDEVSYQTIAGQWFPLLQSITLAQSFLNCRNVVLHSTDPDPGVNRERRKAGLKPFVRYHTIDIEPMKKVLRTEGNIEANGLKKALHIVRGHFAHYTEEKPLFGRPGLHGRFWMPSHVRGSLDQGAVISDYRVKAPAGDG